MKNTNTINKKQNQQIAALNRKVAALKMAASMPKKAKKKFLKKTVRVAKGVVNTTVDPVKMAVKAVVRPFDVPKGIASPLRGLTKPSQKFMAKASTTITIPAQCTMVFMSSPCVAAGGVTASVVFGIQSAAGTPMSGFWKNSLAGVNVISGGTISFLATNTPYSTPTLNTAGYEWMSVSSAIRFSYEGTMFNQSGTFRYIHDPELGYNPVPFDFSACGPATLISYLDNAPNVIRQNILKNGIVEINTTVPALNDVAEGQDFWGNSSGNAIGGASANLLFGTQPGTLGVFLNSSTAAVSFHVETIEHWAVCSPSIQSLHTDSVSHPVLYDQVTNFLASSRQQHANQPNDHHVSVMKNVQKTMGSPLGHEVLNAALTAALA